MSFMDEINASIFLVLFFPFAFDTNKHITLRYVWPQVTCMAVAEAYRATGGKWNLVGTGIVCLVRDATVRSYYIKLIDPDDNKELISQEVYEEFKFSQPETNPYFLQFTGKSSMLALNFAEDKENGKIDREQFKDRVQTVVKKLANQKRNKSGSSSSSASASKPTIQRSAPATTRKSVPPAVQQPSFASSSPSSRVPAQSARQVRASRTAKGKKKKLTKLDISNPDTASFKHIQHVGYNTEQGMTMENLDPTLRDLFEKAGVSQKDLENDDTRQFINEFMETKKDDVDKLTQLAPQRAAPSAAPPPPPPLGKPALPHHHHGNRSRPPPPPSRADNSRPPPPPPPSSRHGAPPPPPPTRVGPPPPPPPAMPSMDGGPAPPPPPPPPPAMGMGGMPSAGGLLGEIQMGAKLKSAPVQEKKPSARGGLLDQIQSGKKLKKVDVVEKPEEEEEVLTGVAGALKNALAARFKAVQDDDDDDDSDDDEWSDDDSDDDC